MIYLDNCSTTIMRKEVSEYMKEIIDDFYANPSSLHRKGVEIEEEIEKVRADISNFLGVDSKEIYFTSGGTEGNNLAILSTYEKMKKKGKHIIASRIEHPSVLEVLKHLEGRGAEISYLDIDKDGNLDPNQLKTLLREDTILLTCMLVNNEIGSLIDIERLGQIVKAYNEDIVFHVDGVQGFLKVTDKALDSNVDIFTISGHKIYGPKGIGAIYVKEELGLEPVIFGGGQERNFRSGTENTLGILAMGKAVNIMRDNFSQENLKVRELKEYFLEKIQSIDNIIINTPISSSPYIVNVSFKGTRGEVLLHYLEMDEIYVSTSSACSSNGTEISHVLKAKGLKNEEIEGSLRFCFAYYNNREDIDRLLDVLVKRVEEVRSIIRGNY